MVDNKRKYLQVAAAADEPSFSGILGDLQGFLYLVAPLVEDDPDGQPGYRRDLRLPKPRPTSGREIRRRNDDQLLTRITVSLQEIHIYHDAALSTCRVESSLLGPRLFPSTVAKKSVPKGGAPCHTFSPCF